MPSIADPARLWNPHRDKAMCIHAFCSNPAKPELGTEHIDVGNKAVVKKSANG
jgi:hypothetical protein